MDAILKTGKPDVPKTLLRGHGEARAELVGVSAELNLTTANAARRSTSCSKR